MRPGMMLCCVLAGAALLGSRAEAALPKRKPPPAPRTITAPLLVLKTGHIAVQVRVNGKGPFRLILDTGSPLTFLSGRAAQRAGLIDARQAKQPTLFGMRGQSTLESLDIGGVRVNNLDVLILDHPVVEMLGHLDGPLDGIVGFSFFSRFRTTIDYAAGRVSFTPVAYHPEDVMSSLVARLSNTRRQAKVLAPAALWGLAVGASASGEPGVLVTKVYATSPAEAAGLQVGDRITVIDGRWTENLTECYEAASRVRPGETVAVKLVRGTEELSVKVRPRLGL